MGRGPNRPKAVATVEDVSVKIYLDDHSVDIAYPDRKRMGFYLKHFKDMTPDDLANLRMALNELDKSGVLPTRDT